MPQIKYLKVNSVINHKTYGDIIITKNDNGIYHGKKFPLKEFDS
jgi:hypothetical protein